MTDLRTAAQALVDRWDAPLWKVAPATAEYINALRAALSAPAVPRAALTDAEITRIFRRSVKEAERDNTFPHIFARAVIAADRGEKQ